MGQAQNFGRPGPVGSPNSDHGPTLGPSLSPTKLDGGEQNIAGKTFDEPLVAMNAMRDLSRELPCLAKCRRRGGCLIITRFCNAIENWWLDLEPTLSRAFWNEFGPKATDLPESCPFAQKVLVTTSRSMRPKAITVFRSTGDSSVPVHHYQSTFRVLDRCAGPLP